MSENERNHGRHCGVRHSTANLLKLWKTGKLAGRNSHKNEPQLRGVGRP